MKNKISLLLTALLFLLCEASSAMTVTISVSPNDTICRHINAMFTAAVAGCTSLVTFQWYVNSNIVQSGNNNVYKDNNLNQGDCVYCIAASPSCGTATSNSICMTVFPDDPPVIISMTSVPNPSCLNNNVTFTAVPSGGLGSSPSYQWYDNSIAVPGAVNPMWNTSNLTTGIHVITFAIFSSDTCASPNSVTSPIGVKQQVDLCYIPMPSSGNPPNIAACGGQFMDSGGPAANYTDNENGTVSICPVVPGQFGTVQFILFAVPSPDLLTIYSGDNSTGLVLIGNYNSLNPPGNGYITSFASNGCLTFSFVSNSTVVDSGWVANYSCSLFAGVREDENNSFIKIYPNPSTGKINLHWENTSAASSEIFISDCLGKIISAYKTEKNYLLIDEPGLSKGVYVVNIISGKNIYRAPVVIY